MLKSKVTGNVFIDEFIPYNYWFALDVTAAHVSGQELLKAFRSSGNYTLFSGADPGFF